MKPLWTAVFAAAVCGFLILPAVALARISEGTGMLTGVSSPDGGACIDGPKGSHVQYWDVQPGLTYTLTISNVTECSGGTMNVRVNHTNADGSSSNWDLVATYVSEGVYQFDFAMPTDANCTYPSFYCTTPGDYNSGYRVMRNDGASFQAHLRASTFDEGCTNPVPIVGPQCSEIGTEESCWGAIKEIFR